MNFFQGDDVRVVRLADWLNWAGGKTHDTFVALPMIQRGSVWKPNQIVDLWDSLLQGMPIGSMMVSELPAGTPVCRPGKDKHEKVPAGGGLALIDGQQRTLAMLIAWQLAEGVKMDRRIWVDFADDHAPGQLLRLRVTTKNQPFGFQRNAPSSKLSLDDRRKAREAFEARNEEQEANLTSAWPFSHDPGLPIDLRLLIDWWDPTNPDSDHWTRNVIEYLKGITGSKFFGNRESGKWQEVEVWKTLDEKQREEINDRIEKLRNSLTNLFRLQMPLIRVDKRFFEVKENENADDPPLAVLFKRIGTNGTPLLDADYVYSVIKHLRPEAYDLVETLHHQRNVASLLTGTDLVMSAVRLAATTWRPDDNRPVPDLGSPSKQDFHRLLQRGEFIDEQFLPLIQEHKQEKCEIARYFGSIHDWLSYNPGNDCGIDIGLPKQAFPLLKRPLVQVLLRLAQEGYFNGEQKRERRKDVLRLVLFWLVAVTNQSKASRLAFDVITEKGNAAVELGRTIHDSLIENKVAVRLPAPDMISERPGLAFSDLDDAKGDKVLRGESRFDALKHDDELHQTVYHFWRNHWWRPWTYQHPILLWLQRDMVANELDPKNDPMAGKDEDTPYDYDHILPSAHWHYWTGITSPDRLLDFAEDKKQIGVVGNAIGNVRVWTSSLNRSDGDAPPTIKLELGKNPGDLLRDSAIADDQAHLEEWRKASGSQGRYRSWNRERARAFQRAAEQRTFYLYERYFTELQFSVWHTSSTKA